jgi:hypothetical protein
MKLEKGTVSSVSKRSEKLIASYIFALFGVRRLIEEPRDRCR